MRVWACDFAKQVVIFLLFFVLHHFFTLWIKIKYISDLFFFNTLFTIQFKLMNQTSLDKSTIIWIVSFIYHNILNHFKLVSLIRLLNSIYFKKETNEKIWIIVSKCQPITKKHIESWNKEYKNENSKSVCFIWMDNNQKCILIFFLFSSILCLYENTQNRTEKKKSNQNTKHELLGWKC